MFLLYRTRVLITYRTSDTLFVPFSLQKSKSLIFIHAARVGNNRHRVFVLLCARCLKPCLHGVRLQPLAKPSSKRKEAQGENALCLRAEEAVSDKCRERLYKVEYKKRRNLDGVIECYSCRTHVILPFFDKKNKK